MSEEKYNLRYLVMPDFVYQDDRLSSVACKIYCFIHTFKGEYFFFSNDHMAEMFKCTPQRISDAITQLKELDYISVEYRIKAGGGKTRLVVDNYSDYKRMTSRPLKSVPTTSHERLDNDINGNKGMANFSFSEENKAQDKEDFEEWKSSWRENRSRPKSPGPSGGAKPRYETKPKKPGTHLEDIV